MSTDPNPTPIVRSDPSILPVSPRIWDAIPVDGGNPMQRSEWVRAAAETLADPHTLRFPHVGPAIAPLAIAPLTSTPDRRALSVLGSEDLWEASDLPARDPESLARLARVLARLGRPIHFGHVPADSPLLVALRIASRTRGTVVTRELSVRANPRIDLDQRWHDPLARLSGRRRSDHRRMRRHAEEQGDVTASIIAPTATELPALLDEVFAIEEAGWKGRAGTAVARDGRLARFFRRYGELAQRSGILRVARLKIGGITAAVQLAVECDHRYWLLKIGYDEAFARCSPGGLLLAETIADAAQRGLRSFEFLGKESGWTQVWTQDASAVVALRYYPWNPRGAWALTHDGVDRVRRRVRTRRVRARGSTS